MGQRISDFVGYCLEYDNTSDVLKDCTMGIARALVREKLVEKLGEAEMDRIHEMNEDDDGKDGEEYLYDLERDAIREMHKQVNTAVDRIWRGSVKIGEVMNDPSTMLPKTGAEVSKRCGVCDAFFLTVNGRFCGTCQTVAVVKYMFALQQAQRWRVIYEAEM